jgi:hypothetical protein
MCPAALLTASTMVGRLELRTTNANEYPGITANEEAEEENDGDYNRSNGSGGL